MYLLDTNVLSELRKPRPHGALIAWYERQPFQTLAIPSVVVYEIQSGANRTRKNDSLKADAIEKWLAFLLADIVTLPFGTEEARAAASLMQNKPLDLLPDVMIAATAKVYGLTVVTRNVKDFEGLSVRVLNPFSTAH